MTTADPQFEGVYGTYTITDNDRREVQRYRVALLISGLSFSAGLLQWWQWGGQLAWLWVLPLAASIGFTSTCARCIRPCNSSGSWDALAGVPCW